jgi:acetoin:2,6-dichlorophenolindophenol oxidoreductase subunit beta
MSLQTSEMEYTYAQAVNSALDRELSGSDDVILFGEDVGAAGGIFGVTKGLQKKYGRRVFDTPISESAILGAALGASLVGMRPIAEVMWADFMFVALDQIVNQAANVRYVSRGRLTAPLTIRTQQGATPGSCAQHSQSIEAILAHIPGIYVCMPFTTQDAYSLTRAAVALEDPVISIEARSLYHDKTLRTKVDAANHGDDVGRAHVLREGASVTVVSWGPMLSRVLSAAESLAETSDIHCEVIDMRWLRPLDIAAVRRSLEKTGRLVVVHEAHTFGGLGGEIVSRIAEQGPRLRSAPVRLGARETRIAPAPTLLEATIPSEKMIQAAIRNSLND